MSVGQGGGNQYKKEKYDIIGFLFQKHHGHFHPEQHIFLFTFLKQGGFFSFPELKYKQRQKQMNSVNILSMEISGILSGFLIPLLII